MKRTIGLLAVCQALMMTSQTMVVTTSALVGFALAPAQSLATLPYALQFIAVMTVTYFASLLMGRIGRKRGFLLASVVGCVGASVATGAIVAGSFALFCLGSFLFGVFFAFSQYYRFAAAEAATAEYRSRAIPTSSRVEWSRGSQAPGSRRALASSLPARSSPAATPRCSDSTS